MTTSNRERRRAQRVHATFPIQLDGRGEGQLRDLSEIGLCCTYPEALDEMALVKIGLQLPGDAHVHEVHGAIVRCEPLAEGPATALTRAHEIAVYFTDVPAASKRALRAWIAGAEPADELSAP